MTLKERLREINSDSYCNLVEDLSHWADYGITTAAELNDYLTREAFSNVYKDRNGTRPYGEWTLKAMEDYLSKC